MTLLASLPPSSSPGESGAAFLTGTFGKVNEAHVPVGPSPCWDHESPGRILQWLCNSVAWLQDTLPQSGAQKPIYSRCINNLASIHNNSYSEQAWVGCTHELRGSPRLLLGTCSLWNISCQASPWLGAKVGRGTTVSVVSPSSELLVF